MRLHEIKSITKKVGMDWVKQYAPGNGITSTSFVVENDKLFLLWKQHKLRIVGNPPKPPFVLDGAEMLRLEHCDLDNLDLSWIQSWDHAEIDFPISLGPFSPDSQFILQGLTELSIETSKSFPIFHLFSKYPVVRFTIYTTDEAGYTSKFSVYKLGNNRFEIYVGLPWPQPAWLKFNDIFDVQDWLTSNGHEDLL